MCAYTQEVLADLHMENWSNIFRITSVEYDQLFTTPLFDEPVWHRPDSPTPVPLFPPPRSPKILKILTSPQPRTILINVAAPRGKQGC
jgi:hypothetical protein